MVGDVPEYCTVNRLLSNECFSIEFEQVVVENVKGDGSGRGAFEYGDISVDEGSRVSSDLVLDPQRMHLYVMTERKVGLVFLAVESSSGRMILVLFIF